MSDSAFQEFGSERFVRRLGRIDEVKFGFEDHGLFGFHIGVDFGGMHSGTGWRVQIKDQIPINGVIPFQQHALMEALGVDRWEALKGKVVWALFEKEDPYNNSVKGFIRLEFDGIGSIVFDDVIEASRMARMQWENKVALNARSRLIPKIDARLLDEFKQAWKLADENGLEGKRVRAGLEAVFASVGFTPMDRIADEQIAALQKIREEMFHFIAEGLPAKDAEKTAKDLVDEILDTFGLGELA